jgi:hypothetical protein
MQPIRLILEDAPETLPIPEALRHQRVEVIFWPLDEVDKISAAIQESPRQALARVLTSAPKHTLIATQIDTSGFHFNREEANER